MILFVYQVADRTLDYFDYNTTVSVKVRYKDQVPFPAVTVCDINTFRFVILAIFYDKFPLSYMSQIESMMLELEISRIGIYF